MSIHYTAALTRGRRQGYRSILSSNPSTLTHNAEARLGKFRTDGAGFERWTTTPKVRNMIARGKREARRPWSSTTKVRPRPERPK
jgi:hypothetical protein